MSTSTAARTLPAAHRLHLREKVAYGVSDLGFNLVFNVVGLYLMYYYTDVAHLDVAAVGTLFLVVRFVDAFAGPLAGVLIDKTRSRFGRARPWLLRMAVPFPAIIILTFTVPDGTDTMKLVWVYVTYTLMNLLVAFANVPVNALLPSLSADPEQRTQANAFRSVLGQVGVLVAGVVALPMVGALGGGDQQRGFTLMLLVLGAVAAVCFLLSFAGTRERVQPVDATPVPLRLALSTTVRNGPWWILSILNLVLFFGVVSKLSTVVYYFKYTMGDEQLSSAANAVNALSMVAGMVLFAAAARRVGRRNIVALGLLLSAAGNVLLGVASGRGSVGLSLVAFGVAAFGLGGAQSIVMVMMADVIDYGEWRTGVRAQGLISGSTTLGVQFGAGIAGAVTAAVLAAGGFVPNAAQAASALHAIDVNLVWIPLGTVLVGAALLLVYRLDATGDRIRAELADRRAAALDAQAPTAS